jgi:hypothetical protein
MLESEQSKLTQWETELEEYKGRIDNLSERAQTTMKGVREVVNRLHLEAKAKLEAEYAGLVGLLDETEAQNKTNADRLKGLLGTGLETVQQWLKKVRQAKYFASTTEEKLRAVESVSTLVKDFSLELPGLTQTFCSCTQTPKTLIGAMERSSLSIEPHERKVTAWWYMNDLGSLSPWLKEDSEALEREYAKRGLKATIGRYEVNFSTMTQTNVETMTVRKVKRMLLPSWTWQADDYEFKSYSPAASFKLEQAYSHRMRSTSLKLNADIYEINFESMTQKNQVSGMMRHIKRS